MKMQRATKMPCTACLRLPACLLVPREQDVPKPRADVLCQRLRADWNLK